MTSSDTLFFIWHNGGHQPGLHSGAAWMKEVREILNNLSSRIGVHIQVKAVVVIPTQKR